jgi:twinkle protein
VKTINLDDVRAYMATPKDALFIKPASVFLDKVLARLDGDNDDANGERFPWPKSWNLMRLRPAELSIWTGFNGHYKSMILNFIMLDVMHFRKVLIISPEMLPEETLYRMCLQAAGNHNPPEPFVRRFARWTDDRLWIYEQTDSIKVEVIKAVVKYASIELGINHIVIDSLMMCGTDGSDSHASLTQEKVFVRDLVSLAKDHNIHIHLVTHARKSQDRNESKPPGKQDVLGSGHITNLAHNVFSVWWNVPRHEKLDGELSDVDRKKFEQKPEIILTCCKQRNGSWKGKLCLWLNDGLQFLGSHGERGPRHEYNSNMDGTA